MELQVLRELVFDSRYLLFMSQEERREVLDLEKRGLVEIRGFVFKKAAATARGIETATAD